MRASQSLTKNYTLSPASVDLISADVVTVSKKVGMQDEKIFGPTVKKQK